MYYQFFGIPQFQNHYPKYQNPQCNPLLFSEQSDDLDQYHHPNYFFITGNKILTLLSLSITTYRMNSNT
jgi:hypothetical protein